MEAITHLEKVIVGEVSAVTHLEKVIAGETSAVTYTEKVITGEATPITHLQRVIAGVESPVTHLEYVWAGRTPEPTEHEYTGAVPVTFTADGTPLLDFLISGNMSQTDTPTSQNPIQPNETGERTENLLVFDTDSYIGGVNFNVTPIKGTAQFVINKVQTNSAQSCTIPLSIPLKQGTYTLSVIGIIGRDGSYDRIYIRDADGVIANYVQEGTPKTFTLANDTTITALSIPCSATSTYDNITVKVMLNTGSTALPYEPYGYKIPISSANTTTPVYLGEVETTRKIKKYEFTGQETISQGSENYYTSLPTPGVPHSNMYCTHNVYGACSVNNNGGYVLLKISSWSDYTTAEDLKSFFQQEYAAGTPVTVWYVLATPETAVVNEPLMKIGDYADTLSMEQAGVSIPTNNGSTTVDVDTTLKPSEVYIKYKGV